MYQFSHQSQILQSVIGIVLLLAIGQLATGQSVSLTEDSIRTSSNGSTTTTTIPETKTVIELNPNTEDLVDDEPNGADDGLARSAEPEVEPSVPPSLVLSSEKPVVKFELVQDSPKMNFTTPLPSPPTWVSPSYALPPKSFDQPSPPQQVKAPVSPSGNKLGKRFFRKKVISTYDYANKKKVTPLAAASSDPYKSYYRFKFSPKEQQSQPQPQQQPQSKSLGFLQNFAPFKRNVGVMSDGLEKKLTRFSSLRRRSDPTPGLSALSGSTGNAWWTKYLSNPSEGALNQPTEMSPQTAAAISSAFYNAPDYVHNPATQSYMPGALLSQPNPGSSIDTSKLPPETAGLLNFWLQRLYSNALPYIDFALMAANYAKAKEEEEAKNSFTGRIKALYNGRNKLYRQVTPAKKIFSKLNNSPYSYNYGYNQSPGGAPQQQQQQPNQSPLLPLGAPQVPSQVMPASQPEVESFIGAFTKKPEAIANNTFDSAASYLSPAYSYNYNSFRRPDYPLSAIYRQPSLAFGQRPQSSSPLYSRSPAQLISADSSIIVPSYSTFRTDNRPQMAVVGPVAQSGRTSPWNEPKISMIKFSAKDGKSAMASTGMPRESLMETQRKVIQYEQPDPSSEAQYRAPRRIKMGSFIKPRSLSTNEEGKTDGVYIQKYDMSDIFCKTKFKPIVSDTPMVASVSSLTEDGDGRNGRALKRSFNAANPEESKPVVTKYVNSDWTTVTRPNDSTAEQPQTQLRRSKRQTELLDQLPPGTLVKEIDPQTTELLLRLLRNNTNAGGEFQRKKITNIYYVYLPKSRPAAGIPSTYRPSLADRTTTTTSTTTTEAPTFLRNTRPDIARRPAPTTEAPDAPFVQPHRQRRPQPLPQPDIDLSDDEEPEHFRRQPPQRTRPQQPEERQPSRGPPSAEESFRRQPQPRPQPEELPAQRPPPRQRPPQRNRVPQPNRPRPTTTTTTTPPPPPPPPTTPGFMLSEQDYEFGEQLCEGRFRGSVPDPRHDCRLYFTCNPDTIDTFSCPSSYRFDVRTQLCQPAETVSCPRLK